MTSMFSKAVPTFIDPVNDIWHADLFAQLVQSEQCFSTEPVNSTHSQSASVVERGMACIVSCPQLYLHALVHLSSQHTYNIYEAVQNKTHPLVTPSSTSTSVHDISLDAVKATLAFEQGAVRVRNTVTYLSIVQNHC